MAMWHGWDLVDHLAGDATVARAGLIRRTYPPQVAAFSLLHGRPDAEVERAVERAAQRL